MHQDSQGHATKLVRKFRRAEFRPPPLPAVAREVVMQAGTRAPSHRIRLTVAGDERLRDRVYAVAHSPLYATKHPGRSLNDALVRLGLNTLSEIVLEVILTERIFRLRAYSALMGAIRRHSVTTSHLARAVAEAAGCSQSVADRAFVCGLFHDAGAAMALLAVADCPKDVAPPPAEDAWAAAIALHDRVGSWLAKQWRLPQDVRMAMCQHENLEHDQLIVRVVALADALASCAGQSLEGDVDVSRLDRAVASVGIDGDALAMLTMTADTIAQRVGLGANAA